MGGVMKPGMVEAGQLEQIAHGEHPVHLEDIVFLIQFQFGRQPAPMEFLHPRADLQADDGGEFPLLQLRFDHRHQIVGFLLILFRIGVPGDPENFAGDDLHAGEQHVQVVHHDDFQGDEVIRLPHPDETGGPEPDRYLDPRQAQFPGARIAERYQKIHGEVGDERKRMRRIDGLRRQQRVDVVVIVFAEMLFLLGGEGVVALDDDPLLFQKRSHGNEGLPLCGH